MRSGVPNERLSCLGAIFMLQTSEGMQRLVAGQFSSDLLECQGAHGIRCTHGA